jgi:hypothetical protein
MADQTDDDQVWTALVVLAIAPPVRLEGAQAVRDWFAAAGFDVDPVVGISFSISGPRGLFGSIFGDLLGGAEQSTAVELDQAALAGRLPGDLLRYVAAVAIGPPPDFGPGNFSG